MGKLAGKSLNVLMVYQASMSPGHCPFPYSVFTMYWVGKLEFVPSVGVFTRGNVRIARSAIDMEDLHTEDRDSIFQGDSGFSGHRRDRRLCGQSSPI